jgi:hypothetical protein
VGKREVVTGLVEGLAHLGRNLDLTEVQLGGDLFAERVALPGQQLIGSRHECPGGPVDDEELLLHTERHLIQSGTFRSTDAPGAQATLTPTGAEVSLYSPLRAAQSERHTGMVPVSASYCWSHVGR